MASIKGTFSSSTRSNGYSWTRESMLTHIASIEPQVSSHLTSRVIYLAFCAILVYYLLSSVLDDYERFLALGPGGISSTPAGYLKLCFLRMIILDKEAVLQSPPVPSSMHRVPYFSTNRTVPLRKSHRPEVVGIVPHRQLSQRASTKSVENLRNLLHNLVEDDPGLLHIGRSCLEKHSPALFFGTRNTRQTHQPQEIVHVHDIDGSSHLCLHPADAGLVIARKWGERHPLAGRTCPESFVMIYAPHGEPDMEIVLGIVKASIWWVGGVELEDL